jgi:SAM-dependent methyltransferase
METKPVLHGGFIAHVVGARERQLSYYDVDCDPEFEISRPHGCGRIYQFLIEHKFRTGLSVLGFEVAGRSVLEVCCGSGMIAEKFARSGASVTGIDFSRTAVARARERARRRGFALQLLVGDAQDLAFADRSFDVVAVHDGLHHLEHPERAICEMARVARHGVMILDPTRAALTRLAVRLGVAQDVEDAGNEVKRLVAGTIAKTLRAQGYPYVRWKRTLMYYPHRPSGWFRWFDNTVLFALFALFFALMNLAIGRWGNKLALGARR